MKGASISQIINTTTLCCSFLMVWAPISPSFTHTDQLQTINAEGVKITDDSLSKQHFEDSNMPTEDDEEYLKVSAHLKAIESSLMEDIDVGALEYLNSEWNYVSQELHTILVPQDLESISEATNYKKKRVIEESSAPFPILESNPIASHENSKQRHEAKIVGNHDDAYRHRKKSHSKAQDSKSSTNSGGIENQYSYSQFLSNTASNLLKLKGGLALWHNTKVSNQIDAFFDKLDKSSYSTLWSSSYTPDHVISAIERVKRDVVTAYFGGLSIIFQRSAMKVSMEDLVCSGWVYLQKYLNEAFDLHQQEPSQNFSQANRINVHHFSSPLILLKSMLKLDKSSPVQPSLIRNLILNWERETAFHHMNYSIDFSVHSFLSAILYEADLRGKKIRRSRIGTIHDQTSAPSTNVLCGTISSVSELDVKKVRESIGQKPASYLVKIGRFDLEEHKGFLQHAKIFFDCLEKEMKQNLTKGIDSINEWPEIDHSNFMIIDQFKIQNAISAVQFSLMPAFVGLLVILNQHQDSNQVIHILLKTGWELLQAYLSRWRKQLFEDPSSIMIEKGRRAGEIKWYDVKDPIKYFCLCHHTDYLPIEPVWFLYELWYETTIQKGVSLEPHFDFVPSPPNRDINDKILSVILKKGLKSQ